MIAFIFNSSTTAHVKTSIVFVDTQPHVTLHNDLFTMIAALGQRYFVCQTIWKHVNYLFSGLSRYCRPAIIWTKDDLFLIGPLGTHLYDIWTEIRNFSFKKRCLTMSPATLRTFYLGFNVSRLLNEIWWGDAQYHKADRCLKYPCSAFFRVPQKFGFCYDRFASGLRVYVTTVFKSAQ